MAEPRWLNPTEMAAWRTFIDSVGDLTSAFEADLAGHGLTTGDYQVLVYLSEASEHKLRMCDLAAQLRLSPSGLTRRLDGLVKAGLVSRSPSEADRRAMMAVLTPAGWKRLQQAAPDHVESVRKNLFDYLSDTQVRNMAKIFESIQRGLTESREIENSHAQNSAGKV